jgi:hypothetical protein
MTMINGIRTLAAVVLAMLLSASGPAAADRPLPAFAVTDLTSATVATADLGDANSWLLIYTRVVCAPCEQLLNQWRVDDPPASTGRIRVVVGGATPADVAAIRQRFPQLAGATWYADADGSAAKGLALTGAPAVFGLRGQTIVWTSQGALPITRTLIAGWVR